jgi:hypothetical protein
VRQTSPYGTTGLSPASPKIFRPLARGLEYSVFIVFPSENLQSALAEGLGRCGLSFDMLIWAEASAAIAIHKLASSAIFFILFFS